MENRGRQSIRLKGYDYAAAGGYFVTIVTFGRENLFGDIVGNEMQLNTLGKIVQEEWFKTASLRPYVELCEGEFVVMPNHAHGIIWILDNSVGARRYLVGAQRRCAPTTRNVSPHSLGAIVRAFKSAVSYRAGRELNAANIWQRNYYEHIIRNEHDYERIAAYIAANPANWSDDKENPHPIPT